MQFIVYGIENSPEANGPMSPKQMEQLGELTREGFEKGILVTTGAAQATGTRVRQSAGKVSITDAPLIEAKELTGGFAVIRANSVEEALEYAKRFRAIVGDGVSEIVRIFGPEDFGTV
jgi:hypothetical protein